MAFEAQARWRARNPWYNNLRMARERCNRPKHDAYPWYGAKGIKCLLTFLEVRQLWERDKAAKMKKPSLDRIEDAGNYEMENCRFIEMHLNTSAPRFHKRIGCTA